MALQSCELFTSCPLAYYKAITIIGRHSNLARGTRRRRGPRMGALRHSLGGSSRAIRPVSTYIALCAVESLRYNGAATFQLKITISREGSGSPSNTWLLGQRESVPKPASSVLHGSPVCSTDHATCDS